MSRRATVRSKVTNSDLQFTKDCGLPNASAQAIVGKGTALHSSNNESAGAVNSTM